MRSKARLAKEQWFRDLPWPGSSNGARTYEIAQACCPLCGHRTNRASTGDSDGPKPGDPVVCINCAAVNVFDERLALRRATDAETAEFYADPHVRQVQRMIIASKGLE